MCFPYETIDTTTNHPFYVEEKGWVAAGDLEVGDVLYTADGDEVEVTDIELEKLAEPITVYNLEVEDFHTYFVGEYGVLVHNSYKPSKNIGNYTKYDPKEIEKKFGMKPSQYHNQVKGDILSKAKTLSKEIEKFLNRIENPDILLDRKGYMALQEPGIKPKKLSIVLGEIAGTIFDYIKQDWSAK